jgi:hypothetical protein
VTKESDNLYKLHFNKKLENIETKRLKLIFQDQDTEKHTEVTIVEMRDKKLIVLGQITILNNSCPILLLHKSTTKYN